MNGRVCENLNLSRALGDFNYKDFSTPPEEHIISGVPDLKTVRSTSYTKKKSIPRGAIGPLARFSETSIFHAPQLHAGAQGGAR